jgi:hypothetical protein
MLGEDKLIRELTLGVLKRNKNEEISKNWANAEST